MRNELQRAHAARRVAETLAWPAGRSCSTARLREAWAAYRYGLDAVVQGGSVAAGPRNPAVERRLRHAIALYEQAVAARPPGWPESGPAALVALASQGRAVSFAGDVGRLLILAKQMRAARGESDPERVRRAQAAAERRAIESCGPLLYRRAGGPRLVSPEHRRQQVRDRVLLGGGDPASWPNASLAAEHLGIPSPPLTVPDPFDELDGRGARAQRYRAELAAGRFALRSDWTALTFPTPKEASRR